MLFEGIYVSYIEYVLFMTREQNRPVQFLTSAKLNEYGGPGIY